VRCEKCSHYFCWQCGGPGADCGAFYCRKSNRSSHEELDFDKEKVEHLDHFADLCNEYRKSSKLLGQLPATIAKTESERDVKHLVKSVQLIQVLNWLYLIHISALMGTKNLSPNLPFKHESQTVTTVLREAIASCTGQSAGKEKAAKKREEKGTDVPVCIEYDFQCKREEVMKTIDRALVHGLSNLLDEVTPKSSRDHATPQPSSLFEEEALILNPKRKRPKQGWKGKQSRGGSGLRQQKWKGKQKAIARRSLARLDANY
jgi:hypothetical protein